MSPVAERGNVRACEPECWLPNFWPVALPESRKVSLHAPGPERNYASAEHHCPMLARLALGCGSSEVGVLISVLRNFLTPRPKRHSLDAELPVSFPKLIFIIVLLFIVVPLLFARVSLILSLAFRG